MKKMEYKGILFGGCKMKSITIEELIEQGYEETTLKANGMPILKSDNKRMIVEPMDNGGYKIVCEYLLYKTIYR